VRHRSADATGPAGDDGDVSGRDDGLIHPPTVRDPREPPRDAPA
jgi:hypothetical protein